jgi:hypothetical protein
LIWLGPKKGIQHVDCGGSKQCSDYLKASAIVFAQHIAALANAGAFHKLVGFENMGYADPNKNQEHKN